MSVFIFHTESEKLNIYLGHGIQNSIFIRVLKFFGVVMTFQKPI
jgi:hypothetical protein